MNENIQIDGSTRLAAVVANPIKHSLSPFIHNRAFELMGVNGVYLAWETKEAYLTQMLANIRLLDMYGVNLSMPFKQLSMWYVNDLTEGAKLIGAINTIVNTKGWLVGHNTDGIGFFKSLAPHNYFARDKEITVLGGGGAAIAIIAEAAMQNAHRITVFNRYSATFEGLKIKLARIAELTGVEITLYELENETALQNCLNESSLLVNATSVGMDGSASPISLDRQIGTDVLVCDVIYKVAETPFLKWAKNQGAATLNGVGMLLYQAAESFKLWTGQEMPVEIIGRELEAELAKKQSTIFSGGLSQSLEDGQ